MDLFPKFDAIIRNHFENSFFGTPVNALKQCAFVDGNQFLFRKISFLYRIIITGNIFNVNSHIELFMNKHYDEIPGMAD